MGKKKLFVPREQRRRESIINHAVKIDPDFREFMDIFAENRDENKVYEAIKRALKDNYEPRIQCPLCGISCSLQKSLPNLNSPILPPIELARKIGEEYEKLNQTKEFPKFQPARARVQVKNRTVRFTVRVALDPKAVLKLTEDKLDRPDFNMTRKENFEQLSSQTDFLLYEHRELKVVVESYPVLAGREALIRLRELIISSAQIKSEFVQNWVRQDNAPFFWENRRKSLGVVSKLCKKFNEESDENLLPHLNLQPLGEIPQEALVDLAKETDGSVLTEQSNAIWDMCVFCMELEPDCTCSDLEL